MERKEIPQEKTTIEQHRKQKITYSQSLIKNIKTLSDQNHLEAFSIFEKVRDVIPDHMISNKTGLFVQQCLEKEEEFVDANYGPTKENLEPLKKENMKFISWFRIKNFFKDGKFCLFNDIALKKQVLRDRGYSHIVDALNALSVQPCLVIRLFEYTETNKNGIYSIWINLNGIWKEIIVDDYVPIFSYEENGKAQFYFSSPDLEKREIWMILLEKALAKAYGGYDRLYNGASNYVLRDLTGAPVVTESIIHIAEKQKITEREEKHMNELFKKISKMLERGYILSVIPRKTNKLEEKRNALLQIFNKKYFLGNGIYSCHEYAILSSRAVKNSKGEEEKILQLRNPWINEIWEGDWSKESDLWTEELKKELSYNPQKNGNSQFWISIKDVMNYFEHLQICRVVPGYKFNAIKLKYPKKTFLRAVIRFSAPVKGKYTISIDQKDLHCFKDKRFKYNEVKLTLCKLENGDFTLLSYTSSQALRNTHIRKLIEEGEYYVLVEQKCNPINIDIEREILNSGNKEAISDIKAWRNAVFSIYGPRTCGIKIIECEDIHVIHDYLLYEGWKNYAKQRIGNKLTDFKLTFDDGHKGNLAIYLLSIPKMIIYAFKNENNYGVDINTEIMGITNMEIVGPEGKVGFNQHFKIDGNLHDVFILRETEEKVKQTENCNTSFKMKSIVGTRYKGEKEPSKNQTKVYEFLFFDKPFTTGCMIEKYPQLKIAALYDCFGNKIDLSEEKLEIKMKTKSIVEAVKVDNNGGETEFFIEEDKEEKPPVIPKSPVNTEQKKMTRQEQELLEQEKALLKQQEERKKLMEQKELLLAQQRQQAELINQQKEQQVLIEQKKVLLKQQEEQRALLEQRRALEEQQELLRIAEQQKQEQERKQQQQRASNNSRGSYQQQEEKGSRESYSKQNQPQNPKPPKPVSQPVNNDNELEKERREVTQMDDARLAHLLALSKEQILLISNNELLKLIKYTGIDAFVNLYQADHEYLERLYTKLGQPDGSEEPEPEEDHEEPQVEEAHYNHEVAQKNTRESYGEKKAPTVSHRQSANRNHRHQESLLSPTENFQKDYSMVDRKPAQRYQKKVSRPSFLDKPKQQGADTNQQGYNKIEFEYNTKEAKLEIENQQRLINQTNKNHSQSLLAHHYQEEDIINYVIPGIGESPSKYLDPNDSNGYQDDINDYVSPKKEIVVDNRYLNHFTGNEVVNDRRSYNHPTNLNNLYHQQQRGYSYHQGPIPGYAQTNNFQVVDSEKYINTNFNPGYAREIEYQGYGRDHGYQSNQPQDGPMMNIELTEPFQSNMFTQQYESQDQFYNTGHHQQSRYDNSAMASINDHSTFNVPSNAEFSRKNRSPSSKAYRDGINNYKLTNTNDSSMYQRKDTYDERDMKYGRSRSRRRGMGVGNPSEKDIHRIPYRRDPSRDSFSNNRHSRSPLQHQFGDNRDALISIPLNNNNLHTDAEMSEKQYQRKNTGSLLHRGFNPGSNRRLGGGGLHLRGSGRRIGQEFLSRDASGDHRGYNF